MQPEPVNAPTPARGLRPGALLVSGLINLLGALAVLFGMAGHAADARVAATWALVQFLSGVWAGVLGANSPFLHGLVAGLPALALGVALPTPALPPQFVVVAWCLAPSAALVAAMGMRLRARRR